MKKLSQLVLLAMLLLSSTAYPAKEEKTWTVNFKDSDIHEVIKFVADATGKTVVIDPRVKGKVKVISAEPLNEQELYSLFLSVLEIQGFTAIESGKIVRIIPHKEARSSPAQISERVDRVDDEFTTQVISLQNVSAAKVLPVLRPLVPQQSHLAAYEPGNAIIIADTAANIARIRGLIQKIDRAAIEGTDVVELKYAQADEMVRIISELYPQSGAPGNARESWLLVGDQRTNSVLVKGPDIEREKIKKLISRMDRPGPQSGNVRVVYLEYAEAESLAKVLNTIVQNTQQAEQKKPSSVKASVEADADTNALLITAEGDTLKTLLSVVERLDIRRAQVLVEAIIVEMEDIAGRDLGIQWLFQDKHGVYGSSSDATSNANILGAVSSAALGDEGDRLTNLAGALSNIPGQTLGFGRVRDDLNFNVLLNALQEDTGANILSTPNLLTLDNNAASIVVGQNVPFITGSFTSTGDSSSASNPFQTIQRESIGITLEVTPHINEGDSVVLEIIQEVSSLSGATNINASDIITNERKIETQIMADDGEIVVLGGLIKDDVQEFKRKVPVLGSIPLLGALFRSTSTSLTKTNLLVFIRATVIRDEKEMSGATAEKYSYIRDQQLAKRDKGVTWLNDERLPVLPEWKEKPLEQQPLEQQPLEQQPLERQLEQEESLIVPETLVPPNNELEKQSNQSLPADPPEGVEAAVSVEKESSVETEALVINPDQVDEVEEQGLQSEPVVESYPDTADYLQDGSTSIESYSTELQSPESSLAETGLYTVQLAALATEEELAEFVKNPYLKGLELRRYTTVTDNGQWYAVTWGWFDSFSEAKAAWQVQAERYPALNVWIRPTGALTNIGEMADER